MMKVSSCSSLAGLLTALALFVAAPTGATTYQSSKSVHITPLHEIPDDFYIVGEVARSKARSTATWSASAPKRR